jgi:methoxymalonate biosynthesis acyl carrier protein
MTSVERPAPEGTATDPDTSERVERIIRERLHLEVEGTDVDLFDTGLIDSLAFVELLMALEQEFGVSAGVDDLDLDNFRTIEQIASFVDERREA